MYRCLLAICLMLVRMCGMCSAAVASQPAASLPAQTTASENWPSYGGDNRHHNASAVDVDPARAAVLWDTRFDHPVDCRMSNPGFFGSRHLAYLDGHIALVAAPGRQGSHPGTCYVTILAAANGKVLNCFSTSQTTGTRHHQFWYPTTNASEAFDTGIGITMMNWDAQTRVLFLRNGGDNPGNTAYLPLANAASYKTGSQKGVGAYEEFVRKYPDFQDADGNVRRDKEIPCDRKRFLDGDQWDYGTIKPRFNNQPNSTAFFEIDADSGMMAATVQTGHRQAGGYYLLDKHTGLYGRVSADKIDDKRKVFAKWSGIRVAHGRVFFLGPCDDTAGDGFDTSLLNQDNPDQGLAIYAYKVGWEDRRPNGGYEGPGTAETAMLSPAFDYQFHSPHKPETPEDAESYLELDAFYRNKTWLIDGEGVWAAWKKDRKGNLELIHCDDESSRTYDLGIGAGQRGQDIWGHMSLARVAGRKYIVYYAGNALYRKYLGKIWLLGGNGSAAPATAPWPIPPGGEAMRRLLPDWSPTTDKPLGPAAIAVFDVSAGKTVWTYTLNTADGSGPYPSLPPNEAEGYFDRSAMVVAGRYAYVAWVDASGPGNATLRLVALDITAAKPEPVEITHDLGIAKSLDGRGGVFDLIAVNGALYALVTESNTLDAGHHTWTAQRVVAIGRPEAVSSKPADSQQVR